VSSIFEERDKECLYFKLPYRKKYLVELTGILIENKRSKIFIKSTRFLIKSFKCWLFQLEF